MQLNARPVEGKIYMLRLSGGQLAVLVVPAGCLSATVISSMHHTTTRLIKIMSDVYIQLQIQLTINKAKMCHHCTPFIYWTRHKRKLAIIYGWNT